MRFWFLTLFVPTILFAYSSPGSPVGFVNDFAQILTQEEVASIEASLINFNKNVGVEVALVTVDSLGGDTIENFANKLFSEWQIGDKDKDSGLLILVSEEDRQIRIEVGYGLEPYITDIESSYIISNTLAPNFRDGKFYQGFIEAIDSIEKSIREENFVNETVANSGPTRFFSDYLYMFALAVTIFASVLGRSKSWWAGGVIGGLIGVVISLFVGFIFIGLVSIIGLVLLGLLFDYLVSKSHAKHKLLGTTPWWIRGGGGGGFGGFGGGSSGGGGASGRW